MEVVHGAVSRVLKKAGTEGRHGEGLPVDKSGKLCAGDENGVLRGDDADGQDGLLGCVRPFLNVEIVGWDAQGLNLTRTVLELGNCSLTFIHELKNDIWV